MKLTKLSLAAIVAVGALGSFASATPLEEAIKGVDVSGFARLRYQNNDVDGAINTAEAIRVSGELNLVVPVADGLSFGTTLATDGKNYPSGDPIENGKSFPTGVEFDKYYFLYTGVKDLAVIGGKYTIPAPWAESGFAGSRGNGLVALYSGVKDWTFAGAIYLQTNGFDSEVVNKALSGLAPDLGSKDNLYALGAIGKAGPVDLQFWAAKLEHLIDTTVYAQVSFAQAGFNVRGQVNYLATTDDAPAYADESGIFYGIEAGYSNDQFFVTVGYTQTDDEQPVYALDDDNDGFIKFGQQLYYKTTNALDTATYFIKGGVNVDKFGFELGYGATSTNGVEPSELYGLVSYQYAKNFGVELYYSALDGDGAGDNNELQLQLLYTF